MIFLAFFTPCTTLPSANIGYGSEIPKYIWYFTHLALYLQQKIENHIGLWQHWYYRFQTRASFRK